MNIDLDAVSKVAQTAFYLMAGSVAVSTYRKAKNGLLNTDNTDYHKKVIDRLAGLSEEIRKEFDHSCDKHWIKDASVREVMDRVHEDLVPHK